MQYIKAASIGELTSGQKKLITAEDKKILLINLEGMYYALDNRCPHMGGSLYEGEIQGTQIICPRHGSVFDITNGRISQAGKLFMLKVKVKDIQTYPIKIENEEIFIVLN